MKLLMEGFNKFIKEELIKELNEVDIGPSVEQFVGSIGEKVTPEQCKKAKIMYAQQTKGETRTYHGDDPLLDKLGVVIQLCAKQGKAAAAAKRAAEIKAADARVAAQSDEERARAEAASQSQQQGWYEGKITKQGLKELIKEELIKEGFKDLFRSKKKAEPDGPKVDQGPDCKKIRYQYIELKIANPSFYGFEGDRHANWVEKMKKETDCLNDDWLKEMKDAICGNAAPKGEELTPAGEPKPKAAATHPGTAAEKKAHAAWNPIGGDNERKAPW